MLPHNFCAKAIIFCFECKLLSLKSSESNATGDVFLQSKEDHDGWEFNSILEIGQYIVGIFLYCGSKVSVCSNFVQN